MKFVLALSLVVITACSGNIGGLKFGAGADGGNVKSESISYNLTQNGCSTGEKTFSSVDAMCAGLRDDAFNGYCARGLRYDHFKANCPGKTW